MSVMNKKKKRVYSLIIIFIGFAAFISALLAYTDSMISSGMRSFLKREVITESGIEKAHLDIMKGILYMHMLEIRNPVGYSTDYFLKIEKIYADVSLGELLKKEVIINVLELKNLNINIEQKELTKNYEKIFLSKPMRDTSTMKKKIGISKKTIDVTIERIRVDKTKLSITNLDQNKPVFIKKIDLKGPWNLRDSSGLKTIIGAIIISAEN